MYDTLALQCVAHGVEIEAYGSFMTSYEAGVETKAGEPFTAYALLWNHGGDGITTVQAKCDGTLIAEKTMAVNGGSWRVVEMDLTIDQPGEYTITLGDLSKKITITE